MDVILLFVSFLFLYFGIMSAGFLWKFKKDEFLAAESDRCLNHFCEVDEKWNSKGRMYTRGLAVISENGKKRFVKQAKLCDIGILE